MFDQTPAKAMKNNECMDPLYGEDIPKNVLKADYGHHSTTSGAIHLYMHVQLKDCTPSS